MYKIYINETPLILAEVEEMKQFESENTGQLLIVEYMGKPTRLLNYIDMLEKSSKFMGVILYSSDHQQLVDDFAALYKIIEAAGGVIYNDAKQVLSILRMGIWDFPKGKIETDESKEETAVREVKEETGIQNLDIGAYIDRTYHTYKNKKGVRIIKKTYWYQMHSNDLNFVPQEDESIEEVRWLDQGLIMDPSTNTYNNIRDILQSSQKLAAS